MTASADRIGTILVGYGLRGRVWAEFLQAHRGFELVGISDVSAAALPSGVGPFSSTSLDEVISRTQPRAALIVSSLDSHAPSAIGCLDAGIPVLIEKPLAASVAEGREIVAASRHAGVPAMVVQNFRFLPRERALRRVLADEGFRFAQVFSARSGGLQSPHLVAVPHSTLWDICLHHLDVFVDRVGDIPAAVRAEFDPRHAQAYRVALDWDTGTSIRYEHREGTPGYHYSEYIERGREAIYLSDRQLRISGPSHRTRRRLVRERYEPEQAILDAFATAISSKRADVLSAESGLATLAVVEATLDSIAGDRVVKPRDFLEVRL